MWFVFDSSNFEMVENHFLLCLKSLQNTSLITQNRFNVQIDFK